MRRHRLLLIQFFFFSISAMQVPALKDSAARVLNSNPVCYYASLGKISQPPVQDVQKILSYHFCMTHPEPFWRLVVERTAFFSPPIKDKVLAKISAVLFIEGTPFVIVAYHDGRLSLWDGDYLVRCINAHKGEITSISLSKSKEYLVSASTDKTVVVWRLADLMAAEEIGLRPEGNDKDSPDSINRGMPVECYVHPAGVSYARFNQDDTQILTGAYDNTIRIFNRVLRKCEGTLSFQAQVKTPVHDIFCGYDGKTMIAAYGDHAIRIWDIASASCKKIIGTRDRRKFLLSSIIAPTGGYALMLFDKSPIEFVYLGDNQHVSLVSPPIENNVRSCALSYDGKLLLLGLKTGEMVLYSVTRELRAFLPPKTQESLQEEVFSFVKIALFAFPKTVSSQADAQGNVELPQSVRAVACSHDKLSLIGGTFAGGVQLLSLKKTLELLNYEQFLLIPFLQDHVQRPSGSALAIVGSNLSTLPPLIAHDYARLPHQIRKAVESNILLSFPIDTVSAPQGVGTLNRVENSDSL